MFNIKFESQYKPVAHYDDEKKLRFDPPVYEQRYSAVLRCLQLQRWSNHFKKIVEFGCAEMRLLVFLKTLPKVEHILQVDIDENLLVRNSFKARPLICDYLRQRETQLQVDVYCGSIDTQNDCLLNTDVVIGIEIIEHLFPETIENVPYNIFGFMKPKIAMFTTPNSECNVLFNMTEKFRHDDHKFEWTREQFEDWAYNICTRFPDYKVAFYGIGPGPDGTEHLGCCSQMALFVRCDFYELTSNGCGDTTVEGFSYNSDQLDLPQVMNIESESVLTEHVIIDKERADKSTKDEIKRSLNDEVEEMIVDMATTHIDMESYRLVTTCVYPRNMDERSQEQKIFDEACFHLGRYMNLDDDHYDADNDIIKVPVKRIFELVYKFTSDINEFRYVMRKNNYTIDDNDVFLIKPIYTDSDEGDDMPANCVDALPRQVESSDSDWD
ncbi:hypothetical protein HA402_007398 [Bradysia odoriphaga]|nr:hypothetical protein HA402_007398 [Bradysia odoriphaga]